MMATESSTGAQGLSTRSGRADAIRVTGRLKATIATHSSPLAIATANRYLNAFNRTTCIKRSSGPGKACYGVMDDRPTPARAGLFFRELRRESLQRGVITGHSRANYVQGS